MKLWRLNAVLIIFILGVYIDTETVQKVSEHKKLNLIEINDVYVENDKYIDTIENKNNNLELAKFKKETSAKERNNFLQINRSKTSQTINESKAKNIRRKNEVPNDNKLKIVKNNKNESSSINKKTEGSRKKIKIVEEKNPELIIDKTFVQKFVTYKKCIHKKGILTLVKNDVSPISLESSLIHVTPIFITLNKQTISFFSSTKPISLFKNIKLEKILKITQSLPNTFCFDIIENDNLKNIEFNRPVTLCASSETEMQEWIDAIEIFKECSISVNPMFNNKQILVDYEKINSLTKDKKTKKERTDKLYYDAQKANVPSPKKIANEIKVVNELKHINDIIKLGNLAQNQVQRKMNDKLKEVEQFSQNVRRKKNLIHEIIRKKMEEENEKETSLITIEHEAQELKLLKAVQERIKQLKKKELKDYKTILDGRINEMKSKADDEAKNMMKEVINENRFKEYNSCTNIKLKNFSNKDYISKLCFQYFGEQGHEKCEVKREFCHECCSLHVGIKYALKLFDCKTKCTKIINGIDISPKVKSNKN